MNQMKIVENTSNWDSLDIYLFSNGQEYSPPRKYHLRAEELNWWDATINLLARLQYGSLHSVIELYTTDGKKIQGPLELINGTAYVAVEPPDCFLQTGYDKYLIKATRSWEKRQAKKSNSFELNPGELNMKPAQSNSDVCVNKKTLKLHTQNIVMENTVADTTKQKPNTTLKIPGISDVRQSFRKSAEPNIKQNDRRKPFSSPRSSILRKTNTNNNSLPSTLNKNSIIKGKESLPKKLLKIPPNKLNCKGGTPLNNNSRLNNSKLKTIPRMLPKPKDISSAENTLYCKTQEVIEKKLSVTKMNNRINEKNQLTENTKLDNILEDKEVIIMSNILKTPDRQLTSTQADEIIREIIGDEKHIALSNSSVTIQRLDSSVTGAYQDVLVNNEHKLTHAKSGEVEQEHTSKASKEQRKDTSTIKISADKMPEEFLGAAFINSVKKLPSKEIKIETENVESHTRSSKMNFLKSPPLHHHSPASVIFTDSPQTTDNFIAVVNKGELINLKLNLEVKKEGISCRHEINTHKKHSLTNVIKTEKASQTNIEMNFSQTSIKNNLRIQRSIQSDINNEYILGDTKVIVIRCSCCDDNPSLDDILKCKTGGKKYLILLPTKYIEGERCTCEQPTEIQNTEIETKQSVTKISSVTKKVSNVSTHEVYQSAPRTEFVITRRDVSMPVSRMGSSVTQSEKDLKTKEYVVTTRKLSITDDENQNPEYIIMKQSTSQVSQADGPKNTQFLVVRKNIGKPNAKIVADKSTQTDWCSVLLEARRHEDGRYTFHLPPLYVLRYYELW